MISYISEDFNSDNSSVESEEEFEEEDEDEEEVVNEDQTIQEYTVNDEENDQNLKHDDQITKKVSYKQSNKLRKKSKKLVELDDYKSKSQLDEENIDENSPDQDKDKDLEKEKELINIETETGKQVRFSGVDETLVTESVAKDKDKKQDKKPRASIHDKRESLSQMSTEFDILGRAMTKMYNPIAKTTKEE